MEKDRMDVFHLGNPLTACVLKLSVWALLDGQMIKVGDHAVVFVKAGHTHRALDLDLAERLDEGFAIFGFTANIVERVNDNLRGHITHIRV